MSIKRLLVSIGLLTVCLSGYAYAAEEETGQFSPGAKKTGIYAAIQTGELFFSGTDRTQFADGWMVGYKLGYDFLKYAGVEFFFRMSGHENTIRTLSSNIEPSFFAYHYGVMGKGAYPITRRFYVGGGLGGGIWTTNPNFKKNQTTASQGMFIGELTVEYYLRTRGLSLGIDPGFMAVKQLKGAIFTLSGFIRHTF